MYLMNFTDSEYDVCNCTPTIVDVWIVAEFNPLNEYYTIKYIYDKYQCAVDAALQLCKSEEYYTYKVMMWKAIKVDDKYALIHKGSTSREQVNSSYLIMKPNQELV